MAEPTPPTDPAEPTPPAAEPATSAPVPPGYSAPDAASLQAGYLPPAPGSAYAPAYGAQPPVKKTSTRRRVLTIVIAVVVVAGASIGTRYVLETVNAPNTPQAVARTVDQLKKQSNLPQQVDEFTVLYDVTAEGSDIHYHYTISGADTSGLTEETLSDAILPELCAQEEPRKILDLGIGVQYSYVVEETGDEYHLEFAKGDC